MSFLLSNFLGGNDSDKSVMARSLQDKHAQVEKLCTKMTQSAHLEDRRAAAEALKSLSRTNRLEVGTFGLQALIEELRRDLDDTETAKVVLETLDVLCSAPNRTYPDHQADSNNRERDTETLGIESQFCEIFLKDFENVSLLVSIIGEDDFYLKFTSMQLLNSLCLAHPAQLQMAVLSISMGVAKILDLLKDSREVVRNEGILICRSLVRSNADLQKIVAFQGAFEEIMRIVVEEGGCWAGPIVVQDALELVTALLEFNTSNQNYFRDSICFKQLAGLLGEGKSGEEADPSGNLWNRTKIANYLAALNVFNVLICRDNVDIASAQNSAFRCNYLRPLLHLAFAPKVPSSVSASALRCLAGMIWSNERIQNAFSQEKLASVAVPKGLRTQSLTLPCSPLFAANLILLHGNTQEGFEQRCAALQSLEAYCHCNTDGQLAILSTINAPPSSGYTVGSALIEAFFDLDASRKRDPWHCWFASAALSHLIHGNPSGKMALLKHVLNLNGSADAEDQDFDAPMGVMNQTMLSLIRIARDYRSSAYQKSVIAYLSLIVVWLNESAESVSAFLAEGSFLQYVIERITQSIGFDVEVQGLSALILGLCVLFNDESVPQVKSESIKGIIKNRIGPDLFVSRLSRLRQGTKFHQESHLNNGEVVITPVVEGILERNYDSLMGSVARPTPAGAIASHMGTLAQLSKDLEETRALLLEANTSATQSSSLAQTLKVGIAERDAYIAQLQKIIQEKNARLTQMAHELTAFYDNKEGKDAASSSNSSAEDLLQQVNAYHERYLADQSAIESLNSTLISFQETISRQQARIEELERVMALESSASPSKSSSFAELEPHKASYHQLYDEMQEQLRITTEVVQAINDVADGDEENEVKREGEEVKTREAGIIEAVEQESIEKVHSQVAWEEQKQTELISQEPQEAAVSETLFAQEEYGAATQGNPECVAQIQSDPVKFFCDHDQTENVLVLSPSTFMSPLQEESAPLAFSSPAGFIADESDFVSVNEMPNSNVAIIDSAYPRLVGPLNSSPPTAVNAASIATEEFLVREHQPSAITEKEEIASAAVASPQEVKEVLDFFDNLPEVPNDEIQFQQQSSDEWNSSFNVPESRIDSLQNDVTDHGASFSFQQHQGINDQNYQDVQYPEQETQYQEQDVQYPEQETQYQEQEIQYQEQDVQYPEQETQYQEQEIQYQEQDAQYHEQHQTYPEQECSYYPSTYASYEEPQYSEQTQAEPSNEAALEQSDQTEANAQPYSEQSFCNADIAVDTVSSELANTAVSEPASDYDYSQQYYDEATGYTYGYDQNAGQYYYYDPSTQQYYYYTAEESGASSNAASQPEQVQEESETDLSEAISSNPSIFKATGPPMIPLQAAQPITSASSSLHQDEVYSL